MAGLLESGKDSVTANMADTMELNDIDESSAASEIAYQAAMELERQRIDASVQEFMSELPPVATNDAAELYVDCPHCGKRAMINARAYQIDKLECAVLADKNNPDEPSWLDWDTALIEADFTYECEECGGTIASRMQEIDDMRAAGTYNISTEAPPCSE